MSSVPNPQLTAQQYLKNERTATSRHEYFRGEIFAMTGASVEHNQICVSTVSKIYNQFSDRPCQVYQSDMRVKVSATGLYTYPDIVITCENPQLEDDHFDTLLNPQVIMEVLSDSTEAYDRGKKFGHYRQIESLQEYVLISQSMAQVEKYTRQADNQWLLWTSNELDTCLTLDSVGCTLCLSDIYERIQFPPPE